MSPKLPEKSGLYAIILTLILILLIAISGCKTAKAENDENPDPAHNARNSLDYHGSYYGVLPFDDTEGMEVIITLDQDNSYQKITRYLGENYHKTYEDYGKFTWNEKGNIITLGRTAKPNTYFVGENTLTQLDMEDKKIKGKLAEKYILMKLME